MSDHASTPNKIHLNDTAKPHSKGGMDLAELNPNRPVVEKSVIEQKNSSTAALFKQFSNRHRLNRRNLQKYGLTFNGSLHTYVSELEKKYDVLCERQRISVYDGNGNPVRVHEYWFSEETIACLDDLFLREAMATTVRRFKEKVRIEKLNARMKRQLQSFAAYPDYFTLHPNLSGDIADLALEMAELAKANSKVGESC